MGVTIDIWRARIGLFCGGCACSFIKLCRTQDASCCVTHQKGALHEYKKAHIVFSYNVCKFILRFVVKFSFTAVYQCRTKSFHNPLLLLLQICFMKNL